MSEKATIYQQAYEKLFNEAPKELQEEIKLSQKDPDYSSPAILRFIRAVAEEAEKNEK